MESNMDTLAGDLAYGRIAAEDLAHRNVGSREYHVAVAQLLVAFKALDNNGAFHKIDEHTGYEPAREYLARIKAANMPIKDPAEWGDLSGYAGGTVAEQVAQRGDADVR